MAQSRQPKLSSEEKRVLDLMIQNPRFKEDAEGEPWLMTDEMPDPEAFLIKFAFVRRQELLTDLANLRDQHACAWFLKKYRKEFAPEPDLLALREGLRLIWTFSASGSNEERRAAETILGNWLAWRPTRKLERMWHEYENRLKHPSEALPRPPLYITVRASLVSHQLLPSPGSLRGALVQGVLEWWGLLMYCANPDCVSPYFIAKRKDQTVCDAQECKAEKQRQHALKWWRVHRAKQDPTVAAVKELTSKKGKRPNVTRKAR